MPLAQKLNKFSTTSPSLLNFTFAQVVEGTGFLDLFCSISPNGDNVLSQTAFPSAIIELTKDVSQTDWTTGQEATFELAPFVFPRTIGGISNITYGYDHVDNGTSPFSRITFTLHKWDGTTETDIGTVTKSNDNVGSFSGSFFLPITVTETLFAEGDQLRLTVLTEAKASSGSVRVTVGTDPIDRDGTYLTPSTNALETTQLKASIPFKDIL